MFNVSVHTIDLIKFFGDFKNCVETSQRFRQDNNQLIVVGTDSQHNLNIGIASLVS